MKTLSPTNPSHINTYVPLSLLQIEAFEYHYPINLQQKMWLGSYFLSELPRKTGQKGQVRLHEDTTEENPRTFTADDGDYILRFPTGRIQVMSRINFHQQFSLQCESQTSASTMT